MVRDYLDKLKDKANIHWNISNPMTPPASSASAEKAAGSDTSQTPAAATSKKK
jgi:hypothetical protein